MLASLHKNIKVRKQQDNAHAYKANGTKNAHQRASSLIHVLPGKVSVFHFDFSFTTVRRRHCRDCNVQHFF